MIALQQRNIIALVTVTCAIATATYLYMNRPVPPAPPVETKEDSSNEESKN